MNTSNQPAITASPAFNGEIPAWYDTLEGGYSREVAADGTNGCDSMETTTIPFLVPDGYKAHITASLTVDDWGSLRIVDSSGKERLKLDLSSAVEPAGPRGGHTEWSTTDTAFLEAGTYSVVVTHDNTTYPEGYDPKYNVATCAFSLHASKEPVHAPHEVTTSYIGRFRQKDSKFEIECTINLKSSCSGGPIEQRTFSEPVVTSFAPTEKVMLLDTGKVCRIIVKSVEAHLLESPIYDEATHSRLQKVAVSWTVQSWDGMDPNGEVVNMTVYSSIQTPPWATIACTE